VISEKRVDLSHGQTRYLEAGSGPPVLLLHGVGFTAGGDAWVPVMERLRGQVRAIAPDFVGWGLGDRLDLEYSFAYLVDFVRELQDALGLERAHVVGHSMGGWVATLLAYESPNRVDRLVLVASGGTAVRTLPSMTEFQPPARDDIRAGLVAAGARDEDLEAAVERDWAKTQVPGALESYRKILRHMNEPRTRERYNTRRRLPHIQAPTLIVWGSNDEVNAPEMGRVLQEGIAGSRLEVLEGVGHGIPHECPDGLAALLLEFLA
jgi:pimeloyl-ACP methyl ester carboxylesterase